MKIAIVINTSWNIYNFRMGLIRAFIREGHIIHAIAPKDEYSNRLIEEGCIYHDIRIDSSGTNPIKDLLLLFRFKKIYKSINPDCVLHFTIKPNIYGTLAARSINIPSISNVSGLGTVFLNKGISSVIAKHLYRVAFKYPKKVFFQNHEDLELFTHLNLVSTNITGVLPGSGIDVSKFRIHRKKSEEIFTFLLIARLLFDKGIEEYVEAARILKKEVTSVRFLLLGAIDTSHKRGIPEYKLNNWIEGNDIEYLGTTDDVEPIIHQADCVVLPSYREGTPRTLLEAACCGKPLIATDVPGCNRIVKDNYNGYLCASKNAIDLSDKMRKMVNLSNEDIEQMGIKSRLLVEENFDEKIVIENYKHALKEL